MAALKWSEIIEQSHKHSPFSSSWPYGPASPFVSAPEITELHGEFNLLGDVSRKKKN